MPAPVNADLIQGRWFDGQSSRARPVMVGLRATPQGPSLVLHPLSQPGAEPVVFAWKDVGEAGETEKPMQFWIRTL